MFPDAFFAAVHHKGSEVECFCLKSGAFNQSMLGADVQCNQVLMPSLTGCPNYL